MEELGTTGGQLSETLRTHMLRGRRATMIAG